MAIWRGGTQNPTTKLFVEGSWVILNNCYLLEFCRIRKIKSNFVLGENLRVRGKYCIRWTLLSFKAISDPTVRCTFYFPPNLHFKTLLLQFCFTSNQTFPWQSAQKFPVRFEILVKAGSLTLWATGNWKMEILRTDDRWVKEMKNWDYWVNA